MANNFKRAVCHLLIRLFCRNNISVCPVLSQNVENLIGLGKNHPFSCPEFGSTLIEDLSKLVKAFFLQLLHIFSETDAHRDFHKMLSSIQPVKFSEVLLCDIILESHINPFKFKTKLTFIDRVNQHYAHKFSIISKY